MSGPYLYVVQGGSAFEAAVRQAVAQAVADHGALTTTAHGGIVATTDGRLSDARTPTAHRASHATGGTDALAAADVGAPPTTRAVSTTAPLTGGGDLSASRTLGLEDVTGLTPGTYERATVTVDAKGRVTAVAVGAAGSVADASDTQKGATRLSAAPVTATDPVAVGDNDARVNGKAKGIFKATKTAGQTINAATAATNPSPALITWEALEYHAGGGFDLAGERFVVPAGLAGFWEFEVVLEIIGVEDASNCQVEVLKNGGIVHTRYNQSGSARGFSALGGYEGLLAAGDALTVRMVYNTATSTDTAPIAVTNTYFKGYYKGAA